MDDGDQRSQFGGHRLCGLIFTATDDCGNSISTTATFTIEDTTGPEANAADLVNIACADYDPTVVYDAIFTDAHKPFEDTTAPAIAWMRRM